MATIVHGGMLRPAPVTRSVRRPSSVATSATAAVRRRAIHEAARTREIQRVYRRRRVGVTVVVAVVLLAAVLSVFSPFRTSAAADGTTDRGDAPKYIVAQPSDTLWSIGQRIAPQSPITEVVDELVRLNGPSIQTGQLVRIP